MTIQFKIQIRGIKKPPVWRRIVIPGSFSFYDLHDTIQWAFGWWDEHLYQFQRQPYDHGWSVKDTEREDEDVLFFSPSYDSHTTNVADFIQKMGLRKFVYVYDFGDDWIHDITIEALNPDEKLEHPVCLDGKGACPPEDCGGVWGYEELKEEMSKEEISEFDIVGVNYKLASFSSETEDEIEGVENDDDDEVETMKPITMLEVLQDFSKGYLLDMASMLNLDLDPTVGVKKLRRLYAQAVIDAPSEVLRMMPEEDLFLLGYLVDNPDPSNALPYYNDYRSIALTYCGFAKEEVVGDGIINIYVAEDFLQAVKPHIKKVGKEQFMINKYMFENLILGLANFYGMVHLGIVIKNMIWYGGKEMDEKKAMEQLYVTYHFSVMLKRMSYQTHSCLLEPKQEDVYFASLYLYAQEEEMLEELKKQVPKELNYKEFTEDDIYDATRLPIPLISNPKNKEMRSLLSDELGYNEKEVDIICHELWYEEMNKMTNSDDFDPVEYFQMEVLFDLEEEDETYQKAMALLDEYLDNMPHWNLNGYSPKETKTKEISKTAYSSPPTPIIIGKKIRRNEPCPCGSGKKYKNCCGKGN